MSALRVELGTERRDELERKFDHILNRLSGERGLTPEEIEEWVRESVFQWLWDAEEEEE